MLERWVVTTNDFALFHLKYHTYYSFTTIYYQNLTPDLCCYSGQWRDRAGGAGRVLLDVLLLEHPPGVQGGLHWGRPGEAGGGHVASLGPNKNWNIPFHSIPFIFILKFWSKDVAILQKNILWHILFQDILQRTYPQLTIFDKSFVFVVNIEQGNLPNLKLRFWVLPSWKRHFASPARNETEL